MANDAKKIDVKNLLSTWEKLSRELMLNYFLDREGLGEVMEYDTVAKKEVSDRTTTNLKDLEKINDSLMKDLLNAYGNNESEKVESIKSEIIAILTPMLGDNGPLLTLVTEAIANNPNRAKIDRAAYRVELRNFIGEVQNIPSEEQAEEESGRRSRRQSFSQDSIYRVADGLPENLLKTLEAGSERQETPDKPSELIRKGLEEVIGFGMTAPENVERGELSESAEELSSEHLGKFSNLHFDAPLLDKLIVYILQELKGPLVTEKVFTGSFKAALKSVDPKAIIGESELKQVVSEVAAANPSLIGQNMVLSTQEKADKQAALDELPEGLPEGLKKLEIGVGLGELEDQIIELLNGLPDMKRFSQTYFEDKQRINTLDEKISTVVGSTKHGELLIDAVLVPVSKDIQRETENPIDKDVLMAAFKKVIEDEGPENTVLQEELFKTNLKSIAEAQTVDLTGSAPPYGRNTLIQKYSIYINKHLDNFANKYKEKGAVKRQLLSLDGNLSGFKLKVAIRTAEPTRAKTPPKEKQEISRENIRKSLKFFESKGEEKNIPLPTSTRPFSAAISTIAEENGFSLAIFNNSKSLARLLSFVIEQTKSPVHAQVLERVIASMGVNEKDFEQILEYVQQNVDSTMIIYDDIGSKELEVQYQFIIQTLEQSLEGALQQAIPGNEILDIALEVIQEGHKPFTSDTFTDAVNLVSFAVGRGTIEGKSLSEALGKLAERGVFVPEGVEGEVNVENLFAEIVDAVTERIFPVRLPVLQQVVKQPTEIELEVESSRRETPRSDVEIDPGLVQRRKDFFENLSMEEFSEVIHTVLNNEMVVGRVDQSAFLDALLKVAYDDCGGSTVNTDIMTEFLADSATTALLKVTKDPIDQSTLESVLLSAIDEFASRPLVEIITTQVMLDIQNVKSAELQTAVKKIVGEETDPEKIISKVGKAVEGPPVIKIDAPKTPKEHVNLLLENLKKKLSVEQSSIPSSPSPTEKRISLSSSIGSTSSGEPHTPPEYKHQEKIDRMIALLKVLDEDKDFFTETMTSLVNLPREDSQKIASGTAGLLYSLEVKAEKPYSAQQILIFSAILTEFFPMTEYSSELNLHEPIKTELDSLRQAALKKVEEPTKVVPTETEVELILEHYFRILDEGLTKIKESREWKDEDFEEFARGTILETFKEAIRQGVGKAKPGDVTLHEETLDKEVIKRFDKLTKEIGTDKELENLLKEIVLEKGMFRKEDGSSADLSLDDIEGSILYHFVMNIMWAVGLSAKTSPDVIKGIILDRIVKNIMGQLKQFGPEQFEAQEWITTLDKIAVVLDIVDKTSFVKSFMTLLKKAKTVEDLVQGSVGIIVDYAKASDEIIIQSLPVLARNLIKVVKLHNSEETEPNLITRLKSALDKLRATLNQEEKEDLRHVQPFVILPPSPSSLEPKSPEDELKKGPGKNAWNITGFRIPTGAGGVSEITSAPVQPVQQKTEHHFYDGIVGFWHKMQEKRAYKTETIQEVPQAQPVIEHGEEQTTAPPTPASAPGINFYTVAKGQYFAMPYTREFAASVDKKSDVPGRGIWNIHDVQGEAEITVQRTELYCTKPQDIQACDHIANIVHETQIAKVKAGESPKFQVFGPDFDAVKNILESMLMRPGSEINPKLDLAVLEQSIASVKVGSTVMSLQDFASEHQLVNRPSSAPQAPSFR